MYGVSAPVGVPANLPVGNVQEAVLSQLNEYIREIEKHNFFLTSKESYDLATRYMNPLSATYSSHLHFKSIMEFRFVILFSIIGDGILYLILKSKIAFYFPIVSLSLLTYYFTREITLEKKKKLFGLFY